MRIAHVIYWLSTLGGGPTFVVASLAQAQSAAGHKVTVIPATRSSGIQVLEPGEFAGLSVRPTSIEHHLWWYNRAVSEEIYKQIRGHDIVHIHGNWRYHLLAAAHAASAFGIPYIISPHGNLDDYCYRQKRYFKLPYFTLFEQRVMNRASAIHCCSQMELKQVSARSIKARKFIVPNPVEDTLLKQQPDYAALQQHVPQLRSDQNIISFLGRIVAIKRPEILIAAFQKVAQQFPNWVMVLAGPYEDRALTDQLVRNINATGFSDRIFMPGMINGQAKAALLKRSAIYVQSSIHENFCVSVAEAMCFGVPCLVTKEVALADDIEEAQAGLVCSGEVQSFAGSLQQLMADENMRRQFGANGAAITDRFSPREVERSFTTQYEQCVEENNALRSLAKSV